MLKFNSAWRFDSPGAIQIEVVNNFFHLIAKVAAQGNHKGILEHFKSYFAVAAGFTTNQSSSADWAASDLNNYMSHAAENIPLFIEAFYDACEALQRNNPEIAVPDVARMNRILGEHEIGYIIRPPDLICRNAQEPILVQERMPSLDEQAQETIQQSLKQSEQLLVEGRNRQAVQEILWLLETISTAFQGLDIGAGTVEGKYFNKIADALSRHHKGQTLEQILNWIRNLHGYLSSPTGGGIRHGVDLKAGIVIQPNEARLFCNLTRSYILFLMTEYERLKRMEYQQNY
jgi:hypothetical protein